MEFPFPDWMVLYKLGSALRDTYSWKVFPFYDAFKECQDLITWLDGCCLITDGLSREFTLLPQCVFYPSQSPGALQ